MKAAAIAIRLINRQLHNKVFEQITTPSDNPNYKKYTQELNGILCDKMSESNNKVNYFWGGKSSAIGWDSEWGKLKTVSAEGSKTTGTKRPFGLDCSGFVTWSFINSGYNASAIGHGTKGQIAKCSRISWSSAQAGDLAFYADLSHVGIVAGKDAAGNILVIHCSSVRNNVVITTNSGFGFAARPNAY